jgi:IMP dehydrogenase/GMP reductase
MIKVLKVKENKDGSATLDIEMDRDSEKVFAEYGILKTIEEYADRERQAREKRKEKKVRKVMSQITRAIEKHPFDLSEELR